MDKESRPGFTFFRSFQEAIERCDVKDQLAMYKGIVCYALDRIEPTFENPLMQMAWILIKPNLDKGWVKYLNAKQSSGHPKPTLAGNQNASKDTNQSENEAKSKLNQSENEAIGKGKERNNNIETKVSLSETSIESSDESLSDGIKFDKFLEFWNKAAKASNLKKMSYMTPKRKSHLQARFKECIKGANGDTEKAKGMLFTVVENAKNSSWLNGEGFRCANFDWIFAHPNNFSKVLDGNYNS